MVGGKDIEFIFYYNDIR